MCAHLSNCVYSHIQIHMAPLPSSTSSVRLQAQQRMRQRRAHHDSSVRDDAREAARLRMRRKRAFRNDNHSDVSIMDHTTQVNTLFSHICFSHIVVALLYVYSHIPEHVLELRKYGRPNNEELTVCVLAMETRRHITFTCKQTLSEKDRPVLSRLPGDHGGRRFMIILMCTSSLRGIAPVRSAERSCYRLKTTHSVAVKELDDFRRCVLSLIVCRPSSQILNTLEH